MFFIVQIRIICDKHIIGDHPLHHRMAPVFNIYDPFLIDLRTGIIIPLRHNGKGSKRVQGCHCLRGLLDPLDLPGDGVPDLAVNLIFQRIELILRAQDHILQLF